jgi:nucleolar protein 14
MTGALHFGGGDGDGGAFEPTLKRGDHGVEGGDGDGGDGRRKTKKEVMEELIAKSKYHKGQKTKQREADEDALDKLDDEFRTISSAGLFRAALAKGVGHLKPEGWDPTRKLVPGAKAAAAAAGGEVVKDDYDRLARELALEARGQATNRTRTTEEVEAAEAAALQEAERGRLKRMRGDSDDDDDDGDGDGPASGGYAARRAKARKQAAKRAGKDNEDEDDDTDEDEDRDGIPKNKGHKEGRLGGDDLEGNFEEEEEDSVNLKLQTQALNPKAQISNFKT